MQTDGSKGEWAVYELYCRTSGLSYIGTTKTGIRKRWLRHCSCARTGLNTLISDAIRLHGTAAFDVIVLYEAVDFREAAAVEKAQIAERRTLHPHGYNNSVGGELGMGREVSLETRARMSASAKTRPKRTHSEETKALMSQARKKILAEKPHLAQAIGDFNRGRVRTAEDRAKTRAGVLAALGR